MVSKIGGGMEGTKKKQTSLSVLWLLFIAESFASPYRRSRWCSWSFQTQAALPKPQSGQNCAILHQQAGLSPVWFWAGSFSFE